MRERKSARPDRSAIAERALLRILPQLYPMAMKALKLPFSPRYLTPKRGRRWLRFDWDAGQTAASQMDAPGATRGRASPAPAAGASKATPDPTTSRGAYISARAQRYGDTPPCDPCPKFYIYTPSALVLVEVAGLLVTPLRVFADSEHAQGG